MRSPQPGVPIVTPTRTEPDTTTSRPVPEPEHFQAKHAYPGTAVGNISIIQNQDGSSQNDVSVVIPTAMTDAQRAAYQFHSQVEQKKVVNGGSSQQPKQSMEVTSEPFLTSAALDQRERANGAVTKLQTLLLNIFEAEDQLQPDTSGAQSSKATRYFQVEYGADIERPILNRTVQIELDMGLQKVVNNNRFASIDVEQLGRVMKLCENAINTASSTNCRIDEDTSQDVDEWSTRIDICDQGLVACRSLLRITTAGREEKQLYSEDTLRNLLNLVAHIVESFVIPLAEMRSDAGDVFKIASTQHKRLLPVLTHCAKVLRLLGDLLFMTDVDESAINTAEDVCKTLVFVENATSEKDSALGTQKFETIRLAAMDVVSKVFARYTEQRQSIFDDILTSLEKLPVSRQSARQFKMVDAKPIQLVSALMMRLVQTSATRSQPREHRPIERGADMSMESEDSESDADGESDDDSDDSRVKKTKRKQKKSSKTSLDAEGDLQNLAVPLYESALKDAYYMINYLLQRAMTSTKTGDTPYRNLLDIFIEDFLSVLGNTDWPAAELILRALLARLLEIGNTKTSSAPSKSMALELLGSMATRITGVRLEAQQAAKHIPTVESELTGRLIELHEGILADELTAADLLGFDGPYRAVLEFLSFRTTSDPELQTAMGYHTMQWSKMIIDDKTPSQSSLEVGKRLAHMIMDPHWLESEYEFHQVSAEEARFSSLLITLSLPFCRAFNLIFTKLLNSMAGDQASLRSKSLKSIEQLLEMDPTMLDRNQFVMNNIIKCLADPSTQVRDSALGLISKCLSLRPRMDSEVYDRIVQRTNDANVHVRKRAMKMLKDIYLRHDAFSMRSKIADALIQRIVDMDDTVVELARLTFEDIWMTPFHTSSSSDGDNVRAKIRLQEQTALIVNTVNRRSDNAENVLSELIQGVLSPEKSKFAQANFKVCSQMVKTMFEAMIDPAELPGNPSQQSVLQTLTVFSAASARLFTPDQLRNLQPYVKNLSNDDSLPVYRSAVVILRHTLPYMRDLNKDFLADVQTSLITHFQKLPKAELEEVAACLWMLDGELKNTAKLVRIVASVLLGIKKSSNVAINEGNASRVQRLVTIAGCFVKAFNLDADLQAADSFIRKTFPEFKGHSVASLAVDIICPFTSPKQTGRFREAALECVAMICHAWPSQLMRADVCSAFELAFDSDDRQLVFILVAGLKEFFAAGDKPGGDGGVSIELGGGIATGEERLGNTYVATDRDGAATSIAQRFLKSILRVAIASADELALSAAQVVASINRQGLVHPKESGPCFVALETCPDNKIANTAFQEHRALYHKHETMFEKENMRSIQQAYEYQRDVIHDTLGYVGSPPAAKLHMFWEVLKTGTAKPRKKFLSGVCTKLNFDPSKLDTTGVLPAQVDLTRFCTENLAFFDYGKLDELQHLTAALEKVVSDTGTGVAHAIEVEILRLKIGDQAMQDAGDILQGNIAVTDLSQPLLATPVLPVQPTVDPARLRHLTVCAQSLLLLWDLRTYLRKLWNLSKPAATRGRPPAGGKGDAAAAVVRAPQRIPNFAPLTERFLSRTVEIVAALTSEDKQKALCAQFAELMAVDHELKVGDGNADDDAGSSSMFDAPTTMAGANEDGGYETPSEGAAGSVRSASAGPGSAKKGKKRKSIGDSANNTPRKRGRPVGSGEVGKARRKSRELEDESVERWD